MAPARRFAYTPGVIRRRASVLIAAVLLASCGREVPRPSPFASRPVPLAAVPDRTAPAPKPPWVAHRVVTDAVAVPGGRQHIVKFGETGIAIARAYGVSWSKIVAANHLKPPFTIEIGDRLLLPSARTVAAQSPEDRARAFTVDIDDLITGAEPAGGSRVGRDPVASARRPAAIAAGPAGRPSGARGGPTAGSMGTVATTAGTKASEGRPTRSPVAALPALAGPAPTFGWPLDGRILSVFGAKPGGRFNDGINLKASAGTPVRAAADGVVAYAGDAVAGFGNLILIKHADGWVSAYGHNEALLVARGARVAKGAVIARSGATGAVDEPQLHFELRRGRTPSDPVKLLPPRS